MVLGHEGAGIVESVGEGVTKLKAGEEGTSAALRWLCLVSVGTSQLFIYNYTTL